MSPQFRTVTVTVQLDDQKYTLSLSGFVVNGYLEDGGSLREAVQVMATSGLLRIIHGLAETPEAQYAMQRQFLGQSEEQRSAFNDFATRLIGWLRVARDDLMEVKNDGQ